MTAAPFDALERELAALGRELAWPTTPPIAGGVRAALAADPSRRAGSWRGGWRPARRALVLGVVAAILVIGLVAGIGFALGGLRIVFGGPPPGSPLPAALVAERGFGQRTDTQAAAQQLGGLFVPSDRALGTADHVYYDPQTGAAALIWGARDGLPADPESRLSVVVTEFRADLTSGTFVKLLHEGAVLETTNVGGAPAYWLSGGYHFFFFEGPDGEPIETTIRLVGNTLMWERGELTLRIEGAPTLADALRIAESMQPVDEPD
jgi:hypothetical protein